MIKRKPVSTASWVVGRDFPDPNERAQGTVPSTPPRVTHPIPIPPSAAPAPTVPLYPDEGRAAAPPQSTTSPAPPQSATPPAPTPAAKAPPQQPPAPKPRETSPAPAKPNPQPQTSNYHSGKCSICNHPDRDLIEAAFLNWQPAERIVADFNLPARSTIYRHAKAVDLLNQRRNDFRCALDQIIEQAGRVPATASSIMSAIELSHRLSGADIAPLKRYETTHIYIGDPKSVPDLRRGGPFYPEERRAAPPAVRPHVKRNPQKQSGHSNIVAAPNPLNPKERHENNRDTQGVHET